MKDGKVDAVFFSEDLAKNHQKNLSNKWTLTEIIKKEVYDF
jgi:hypothetical protein